MADNRNRPVGADGELNIPREIVYYTIVNRFGAVVEVGGPVHINVAEEADIPLSGMLIYEQVNPATQYVDLITQQVMSRRDFEVEVSGTTISEIPYGTRVLTEGQSVVITDGSLQLSYDLPGTYIVWLSAPTYNDLKLEITQQ
jgi:hypothetical protein